MMHLLLLAALTPVGKDIITCQTGVIPGSLYRASVDLSDNRMDYSAPEGIIVSGIASHATVRGMEFYHLAYGFGLAAQIFFDGEEWWLCHDQNACLRCGQYLKP